MVDAGILGAEEEEGRMSVSSGGEKPPLEVKQHQCGGLGGNRLIMSFSGEVR